VQRPGPGWILGSKNLSAESVVGSKQAAKRSDRVERVNGLKIDFCKNKENSPLSGAQIQH